MAQPEKMAVLMAANDIRDSFIPPKLVDRVNMTFDAAWNPLGRNYSPDETASAIAGADYCITGWGCAPFTADVLRNAANLKLVAHTGGSVATLVSENLYERGITVLSGNDLYARSVAEGVIAYILTGQRRIPHYADSVRAGEWKSGRGYNEGLLDRTVGLYGFGAVAKYTAGLLSAFNTTLFGYDPYVDDDIFARYNVARTGTPEELCSKVDILSLHMPRTRETYHAVGSKLLGLLPDGALLINTSRGSVIDEKALADELKTGRIRAVLDVYETEPLPADSGLRGLENVILMPHMAGPTVDRRPLVTEALLDDIARFRSGQPTRLRISKEYAFSMTDESLKLGT